MRTTSHIEAVLDPARLATLRDRGAEVVQVPAGSEVLVTSASPDGALVAAGTRAGDLLVVDAGKGVLAWSLHVGDWRIGRLAWSPDGRYVAASSVLSPFLPDGAVPAVLVDAASHTRHHSLGRTGLTEHVHWLADARHVATVGRDEGFAVWQLDPLQAIWRAPAGTAYGLATVGDLVLVGDRSLSAVDATGQLRWVNPAVAGCTRFVALSGSRVACVHGSSVAFVDLADGEVESELAAVGVELRADPEGTRLLTWDGGSALALYDVATGRSIRRLDDHRGKVRGFGFSRDGDWIATTAGDATVRLFHAGDGTEDRTFPGLYREGMTVAWAGAGERRALAAGGEDERLHLWPHLGDPPGLLRTVRPPARGDVAQFLWNASATHAWLVTAEGDVWRVDLEGPGEGVRVLTGVVPTGPMEVVGDGASILARRGADNVLELHGGAAPVPLGDGRHVRSLVAAPSGRRVAAYGNTPLVTLLSWDGATGAFELDPGDAAGTVIFSPDGELLYVGTVARAVEVWDVATATRRSVLDGRTEGSATLCLAPDGSRLVSTGWDGSVVAWNVPAGTLAWVGEPHGAEVVDCSFSGDGTRVATASWDGTAAVLEAATGRVVSRLAGHALPLQRARISPDGALVATASRDHTARVWEAATGALVAILPDHRAAVGATHWSADGARLYTSGRDSAIRVWDVAGLRTRPATVASTGTLTNLRVCRDTLRVVPVMQDAAPVSATGDAPSVWAPAAACGAP